jgi:hypothetical protein
MEQRCSINIVRVDELAWATNVVGCGSIGTDGCSTLNVYTVQNPRRRVILKKTSHLCTICTHVEEILSACLCVSLRQLFSWGWNISVDMVSTYEVRLFKFVTKFIIQNFIIPNLQK